MVSTDRLCMGCMNDNGGEKICPICGHDSSADNSAQYLSIGTWLNGNRYLVGKVIEEDGDCAVYIAWDNDNNAVVNISEYLPAGLARRSADRLTVGPNDNDGIAFMRGMEEFKELHTALSKLTTGGVLPVIDIFESNGTVYSVTTTVSSISLKDFLLRNGGTLKWEQAKPLFMPLLSALDEIHNAGIVHRGISPDTILVGRDGRLYLTGFCIKSARVMNTEFAYKLASGYSAPEQYDIEVEVGPAADVYAMGAVLFRCVIGSTPPDAKERLSNDKLAIPANAAETISKGALVAIANALKVDAVARTGSVDRLKKMVEVAVGTAVIAEPEKTPKKKKSNDGKKYAIIASLVTALVFIVIIVGVILAFGLGKDDDAASSGSDNVSSSQQPVFPQTNIKYNDDGIEVPDWSGKTYSEVLQIVSDQTLELEIVILGKVYSEDVPKGAIVEQSVKGEKVEPNSEIGVYISLGKSTVTMPRVIGLTCDEAKVVLFEAGFSAGNIEFREKVVGDPQLINNCSVKEGDKVSVDELIIIDYNPDPIPEPEVPDNTDDFFN